MAKKNLHMAYIDYKKAYDMVPHSWLIETLKMVGIASNIRETLETSMKNWKTELTANGQSLGEIEIKRGIFQGDSLSPLLFVIVLIPLSLVLRDTKLGYTFSKSDVSVNHLLFMDDLKLYARSERELNSLVHTLRIVSDDTGMKFGYDKCKTVFLNKGKIGKACVIEMPDGEKLKEVEESGYKYLGILQDEGTRTIDMKDKLETEYLRRVRKLAKSKLYAGNVISAINQWALGVMRYSGGVIDWNRGDLVRIDIKTRKILTSNALFHPRANVARLYLKRKDGGRGLISVEQCVKSEENSLWDYVSTSQEQLLKIVVKEDFLVEKTGKAEYMKQHTETLRQNYHEKAMHGKYPEVIKDQADLNKTWMWLKSKYVKKATESLITAAQDQALRTNWIKTNIDKTEISPLCRICHKEDETVSHIVSGCSELAKRRYVIRHDLVATRIHWELCKKYNIDVSKVWYDHVPPPSCISNAGVELIWNKPIITTTKVKHNIPDIVIKSSAKWILIDIAVPKDHRVKEKHAEKIQKYVDLAGVIRIEHNVETSIVPIIVGALGAIPVELEKYLNELDLPDVSGSIQISTITSTARILRDVLSL